MKLEIQKDGVYNVDIANLFSAIEISLDKSELTDEYCKRIANLYKIYEVIIKTPDEKIRQNMKNLFLIESLKLEKFRQNQVESMLNMSENKLQEIFEKVKKTMEERIKSNPSSKELLQKYNSLTKVSLETFRQAIISIYYKRFDLKSENYDIMLKMVSSLDENQIQMATEINIDDELEKTVQQNSFISRTDFQNRYPENPESEDFKKGLQDIERLGFYSIGPIGSFIHHQIYSMCYEYQKSQTTKSDNVKNII